MLKKIWRSIVWSILAAAVLCSGGPVGCAAPLDSSIYASLFGSATRHAGDETIYVVGHMHPDSDAICTAIAYAHLKNAMGIRCEPRANGTINRETAFVLDYFHLPVPEILTNAAGKQIILVDHSSYDQSVPEIQHANILEVLDHHNMTDVRTKTPIFYLSAPVGATSSLVYMIYRSCGIEIPREIAGAMLGSILSDTNNLKKKGITELDRYAAEDLAKIAGIDDVDGFYRQMRNAFLNHEGMSVAEIACMDYKEYTMGNAKVGIGKVVCKDKKEYAELTEAIRRDIVSIHANRENKMDIFMICIVPDHGKEMTLVFDGKMAQKVIEQAFPGGIAGDHSLTFERSKSSRKKFLIPQLESVLANY